MPEPGLAQRRRLRRDPPARARRSRLAAHARPGHCPCSRAAGWLPELSSHPRARQAGDVKSPGLHHSARRRRASRSASSSPPSRRIARSACRPAPMPSSRSWPRPPCQLRLSSRSSSSGPVRRCSRMTPTGVLYRLTDAVVAGAAVPTMAEPEQRRRARRPAAAPIRFASEALQVPQRPVSSSLAAATIVTSRSRDSRHATDADSSPARCWALRAPRC